MSTFMSTNVKCISMQGIFNFEEARMNDPAGIDAVCNCVGVFVGDNGLRLELPINDWQFAQLASRTFQSEENPQNIQLTINIPF
jgi:hypothetical protein